MTNRELWRVRPWEPPLWAALCLCGIFGTALVLS